jgi:hypothetical protein
MRTAATVAFAVASRGIPLGREMWKRSSTTKSLRPKENHSCASPAEGLQESVDVGEQQRLAEELVDSG